MATEETNAVSTVDAPTKIESVIALLDADPGLSNVEIARKAGCNEGTVRRARKIRECRTRTPEVATLPLSSLRLDGGTQMRERIDPDTVAAYAAIMSDAGGWGPFPPIEAVADGINYWVYNGGHRHGAAELVGLTEAPVRLIHGTLEDAIALACQADAHSPLPRTAADKRNAVLAYLALERSKDKSVREIAELCGVSHGLVNKIMHELDDTEPELDDEEPADNGVVEDGAPEAEANGHPPVTTANGKARVPYDAWLYDKPAEAEEDEDAPKLSTVDSKAPRKGPTPSQEWRKVCDDDLDQKWVDSMPCRRKIAEELRPGFDRAALAWRSLQNTDWWKGFVAGVGGLLNGLDGAPIDPMLRRLRYAMQTPHPRTWKACKACKGKGSFLGHPCTGKGSCGGSGFTV